MPSVSLADAVSSRQGLARLLEQLTFIGSLALIAWTAVPYGSVEFWWTAFFEVAVFSLGGLWIIAAVLRDSYESERWLWLAIPAAILVLFSLIQSIPMGPAAAVGGISPSVKYAISADPFETRSFALRFGATALLAIILLRLTTNRARLQALVSVVIGVGVAGALFGIVRQFMQHNEMGFVLRALPRGIGYGQIISRNQFAFMMEISLGVALGMIFGRHARLERKLIYLALALPVATALILANSRGGILTLISQLLFLGLLTITASARDPESNAGLNRAGRVVTLAVRAVIIAVLLASVAMAVVWVGGEKVTSNLSTMSDELKPTDEPSRWNTRRIEIWKATWLMSKDHPLAGVGFGGYWIAVPRYHDASGAYTPQQAHNDYLEILASGGLIGLAICAWLVVVLVKRLKDVGKASDPFRRAAWCGALVGLFGVAMHSIVDFGLHLTVNGALCAALVVIGAARIEDRKRGSTV